MTITKRIRELILAGMASEEQMEKAGGLDEVVAIKTDPEAMNLRAFVPEGYEVKQTADRSFAFAFSNEAPDQGGDIVKGNGWDLGVFKLNPVALWSHNGFSRPPVGTVPTVKRMEVAGVPGIGGDIKMAPEGIDPFVDGLTAFVAAGIVRATSVGFKFLETKRVTDPEERMKLGLGPFGIYSTKHRLFEVSLVSIPMNSNALRRSMDELLTKGSLDREQAKAVLDEWPSLSRIDHARIVKDLCTRTVESITFEPKVVKVDLPVEGDEPADETKADEPTDENSTTSNAPSVTEVKLDVGDDVQKLQQTVDKLLEITTRQTEAIAQLADACDRLTELRDATEARSAEEADDADDVSGDAKETAMDTLDKSIAEVLSNITESVGA